MFKRPFGTLLPLVALSGALAAHTAAAADTTGVTDDTIRIGVPGPLTGPNSSFGAAVYGVQAYYDHVNERGGVHGRKFEVILGDTACNEAKGIAVAKKLISQDEVFLLNGGVCSGVALAMKPVIAEAGVPWVISTAANQNISSPVEPNIFHGVQTSRQFGEAMGKFAMSKPGTEKIAIVAHTNEWAKGYRDPLVNYLKEEHGIEPVAELALERGATDATAQVLSLRNERPDFVVVVLYEPELAVLLRDAHKLGVDVPMVGSLGADFRNTQKRLGSKEAMKSFFMVHQFKGLIDGPEMKEMREAIERNLPDGQGVTDFTFYGPGSAVAIVHVIEQIGPDLTREKFIEGMNNLKDFDTGILAGTMTFTPDDHQGARDVYVIGYDDSGEIAVFEAWGKRVQ
jgi:branched-chain amino acid transport system substrate-binding protein